MGNNLLPNIRSQTLHQAFCCFRLIILQIGKHIQRLVSSPVFWQEDTNRKMPVDWVCIFMVWLAILQLKIWAKRASSPATLSSIFRKHFSDWKNNEQEIRISIKVRSSRLLTFLLVSAHHRTLLPRFSLNHRDGPYSTFCEYGNAGW